MILTFLFIYSLALTISPAVRLRSWSSPMLWTHWAGFIAWSITCIYLNSRINKVLSDSDPYLFSVTLFFTGLGILTIWRLIPSFGMRQSLWFLLIGFGIGFFIRYITNIEFLRKFKYLWLITGLVITALTLFFGVNPLGGETRLWLGCCGLYFQPSEPLKLLFIVFLAAYFSDQLPLKLSFPTFILPSIIVTGIALIILVIQKDLGTALIFIFLFTTMLFAATGKKRVLLLFLFIAIISSFIGYYLFDVVRIRFDGWINPWYDPSGRSYQIVQSLMAISNGGLIGRGPGGGYPGLVPVSISDFIYTSFAEESGLVGTIALLILLAVFLYSGLRITYQTNDRFKQFLTFGITTYVIFQSILIIGGNIRLLPITGVTFPFVSYGGSSLLTSFIGLSILLFISNQSDDQFLKPAKPGSYLLITSILFASIFTLAAVNGWWSLYRGSDLLSRSDNARRSFSDLFVKRGSILSRNYLPINITEGTTGNYYRDYIIQELSPITGYTNPTYGQAGLETSIDDYLRGLRGQSSKTIIIDQILFGQPPPGLDVRISIDLPLQAKTDELLNGNRGAVVFINASTGEVLVMASHPFFNANNLENTGSLLTDDPDKPLLNRVTQGLYPIGNMIDIFLIPEGLSSNPENNNPDSLLTDLGFYSAPEIRLPVSQPVLISDPILISPLQMVLASAALTNDGIRPSPRLSIEINTPENGWVILPALGKPLSIYKEGETKLISDLYKVDKQPFWEFSSTVLDKNSNRSITWYIAGTLFDWNGSPLSIVILLEESNTALAREIGQKLMDYALNPNK